MTIFKTTLFLFSLCFPFTLQIDYQSTEESQFRYNEPQFKLEPQHYIDFPVTKKDFQNWETIGSAVVLRNKVVLAPELKDRKGIIFTKHQSTISKAWIVDVEINVGNEKQSTRGGTGLGIFYVKNVDAVSHKESIFGYTNRFEGLGIYLNTILKSEARGSNREILNAIQGFTNDGTRSINVFSEKKHICFKHFRNTPKGQNFRIRIQYDSPLVVVSVFNINKQIFENCFSFDALDLDFNGYFVLSGSSGVHNPDHVYLHSFKVFDPLTPGSNDHFKEARKVKLTHEIDLKEKLKDGVRDLFEHHSQADIKLNSTSKDSRDIRKFFSLIPHQHNQLQHRLKEVIADSDSANNRFFDTMRGLPPQVAHKMLLQKLFNFRLTLDNLNQGIDKESSKLREYEKTLKQVKYTANIQKGLQQREVNNKNTQNFRVNLIDLDDQLQILKLQFKDYQQAMEILGQKIKQEAGFTAKLEKERKKFAQEQSKELEYDMRDIDEVFNEMELEVVSTGSGMSSMILNLGMLLVIAFSLALWCKMNKFETKNS